MARYNESIAECEGEAQDTSIIMIDNRDDRMVSLFRHGWSVRLWPMRPAPSTCSPSATRSCPPNSGFHLSLFGNYTLDGIKAVVVISVESETGSTCAGWDGRTAAALAHPAFQPFTWPMLRDTSASYTDVKIYNGNEILFHWILRGYRSDTDLTVSSSLWTSTSFEKSAEASRASRL